MSIELIDSRANLGLPFVTGVSLTVLLAELINLVKDDGDVLLCSSNGLVVFLVEGELAIVLLEPEFHGLLPVGNREH